MQALEDIQACQKAFQDTKEELKRLLVRVEAVQTQTGTTVYLALTTLRITLNSRTGEVPTYTPNLSARDRLYYLSFPDATVKNIQWLNDIYRKIEKGDGMYWNSTTNSGQTLRNDCLVCVARLYNICEQSKKFQQPTASASILPTTTWTDIENEYSVDREPSTEIHEDMMLQLLSQLKKFID